MMNSYRFGPRAWAAAAAAVCVIGLAACGGGEDKGFDSSGFQAQQDRDASASVTGLQSFADFQINNFTTDAAAPRSIDGVTPAVSDTAQPIVL